MDIKNSIWVEKYRPDNLDNLIGNKLIKDKLVQYIKEQDIPHLLFTGKAGTGKTTISKILINQISSDYLFINASDENDVETMRTKIKGFAATRSFNGLKIVVLDEMDFLSNSSQALLRNLMEVFSNTTRFILTANYIERIIEPIISRSQHFEVIPPSKKEVAIHLAKILQQENISFQATDVKAIIDVHFPDIRKIIGEAQLHSQDNKLTINTILDTDIKTKVISILATSISNSKKFTEIRQLFADNEVRDFIPIYQYLYEKVLDYGQKNISGCILAIADGQYKSSQVVDQEICMMATIINLLEAIK